MIETINSKLKKLEREAAINAEPVTFELYYVDVIDGIVTRKNARTGRITRVQRKIAGFPEITEYVPSTASEAALRARNEAFGTTIAVPEVTNVGQETTEEDKT